MIGGVFDFGLGGVLIRGGFLIKDQGYLREDDVILHDISQAHAAFSSHVVCAPAYFGAARYIVHVKHNGMRDMRNIHRAADGLAHGT